MSEQLERLYTLRVLAESEFGAKYLSASPAVQRKLTRLLSMESPQQSDDLEESLMSIRTALAALQAEAVPLDDVRLFRNLAKLKVQLAFSDAEVDLLGFAVLLGGHGRILRALSKVLEDLNEQEFYDVMSIALQRPADEISAMLQPASRLISGGLLGVDCFIGWGELTQWLDMKSSIRESLVAEHAAGTPVFGDLFCLSPAPALTLADYPHLEADIRLMQSYLQEATKQRRIGVNVLLYGPPGTGKTQLVRALAGELGARLFEVSVEKADGYPIEARERINAYRLAQGILHEAPGAVLLFDEVEDVFPDGLEGLTKQVERRLEKGWVNRMLEHNKVPAVWVTNSIHHIDAAFMRRFDLVLEVNVPPTSVRKKLIKKKTAGLKISDRWVGAAAHCEFLGPAHVDTAVKVVKAAEVAWPDIDHEAQVERILKNRYRAQGRQLRLDTGLADYDPQYLNADVDIDVVIESIKRSGEGRLCLFGPPGTGKTAFGQFIARELGRPLLVRRASDLLGMYVGETERRIAHAFARADEEGAVLLIDEADSFLRSRQAAERPYEVQMVNEMLTQLETFNGVLVASTNLPEMLDHATLRRFDYKIKLSPLNTQQTVKMLRQTAHAFGWQIDDLQAKRAEKLANLTPGDFAVVTRRLRNEQSPTLDRLLDGLKREAQFKQQFDRRPIGFATAY